MPHSTGQAYNGEHGCKVYITGGTNLNCVQVFDIVANTFSVLPNKMTQERFFHTSCLIGETVYNFGGVVGGALSDSAEAMNISEGVWRPKKKLPSARSHLRSCVIGDRAFLFGGYLSEYTATDEILIYNPADDSYSSGGQMLDGRENHTSDELGGRVLIAGGHNSSKWDSLNSSEIFDAHAQKSVEAAPLDYKICSHASSKLSENTVVISGGSISGIEFRSEISVFDTRANKWNQLAVKLASARSFHQQVTLDINTIIVFGGTRKDVEVVDLRL
eukprot:TRINITY_DN383_c1_g2_i6.p1 TRINITY_DN383_c1_g2~~TRINITY_DN383_c1_g2_i6.p1  ORF type:complete len:274 (+),score=49.94 TRINITY_DN383_c1_g2_i6:113-934(+)